MMLPFSPIHDIRYMLLHGCSIERSTKHQFIVCSKWIGCIVYALSFQRRLLTQFLIRCNLSNITVKSVCLFTIMLKNALWSKMHQHNYLMSLKLICLSESRVKKIHLLLLKNLKCFSVPLYRFLCIRRFT